MASAGAFVAGAQHQQQQASISQHQRQHHSQQQRVLPDVVSCDSLVSSFLLFFSISSGQRTFAYFFAYFGPGYLGIDFVEFSNVSRALKDGRLQILGVSTVLLKSHSFA